MTTTTDRSETVTVPLLVAIAPATGATGRDKVAGPVCSLGNADHLLATRRPFRTGHRTNEWTGFAGHSVTASLYRVDQTAAPLYWAPSTVLVNSRDSLTWGAAPTDVRALFRDQLADAIAATPEGRELQCYLVRSYDTPIAWGFHHVAPGTAYAPRVETTKEETVIETSKGRASWNSDRHTAASLLTVPEVRYSQTTTQHQSACLGARVHRDEPGRPLTSDEYHGAGTVHLTIGERVDAGDPGAVTRGRGRSPFGPRLGW